MKRALVILTLVFISGILAAGAIKMGFLPALSLSALFLISAVFFFKRGFLFNLSLSLSLIFLGASVYINSFILPRCHICRILYYKNDYPRTIKGFINTQPLIGGNKTSFVFRAVGIKLGEYQYNCCGDILVYLKGKKDFSYGEELILRGSLYRPFGKSGSYGQGYKNYLHNQGIFLIMRTETDFDVIRLVKNKGCIFKRFAFRLKQGAERIIRKYTSSVTAAVLEAMLLGDKKDVPALIYSSMMRTGTVHILVVSGFNVGIVAFIILLLLKLIKIRKKWRLASAIPLLMLYSLITGASTPVVRSTIMAIVFIAAYLINREPDIYNACAFAAIIILMHNPRQVFDIGFQLSFSSVISIVFLYPKIKSLMHIEGLKARPLRLILEGTLVSLSAWLGTLLFLAYYFRIFSPITVLANLFILPLATFITLCGLSLVAAGLMLPAIAPFFASTTELAVTLLIKSNYLLLKLPGACLQQLNTRS